MERQNLRSVQDDPAGVLLGRSTLVYARKDGLDTLGVFSTIPAGVRGNPVLCPLTPALSLRGRGGGGRYTFLQRVIVERTPGERG